MADLTREEATKRLAYLENEDPRRDPRNPACATWIAERDQVIAELQRLQRAEGAQAAPARPPLGPLSRSLLDGAHASAANVPLWVAVELTEAGYTVESWPEYREDRRLWSCYVSDRGGRRHPLSARVRAGALEFSGISPPAPTRHGQP